MATRERIREVVQGPLSTEYLSQREEAGWKLVFVEWEREAEAETPDVDGNGCQQRRRCRAT